MDETKVARGLGWFSIGLGLAQLARPDKVAKMIGVHNGRRRANLIRAIGVREIASGIGILTQRRPAPWLWSRVAGDVMDLALLGTALAASTPQRDRTTAATAAVLGVGLLDLHQSRTMTPT